MILNKEDASTSAEQVETLSIEYNMHYRACVGSWMDIYIYRCGFMFCNTQARNVFIKSW